MAAKLLEKRFGIKNVKDWMKEYDADNDGRLSYHEFKRSLKSFLNIGQDNKNGEGEEA